MTDRTEFAAAQNITIEDICLQAVEQIDTLIALLTGGQLAFDKTEEKCAEVQMLLEALPLSTDEFALAGNRLRNAARYLKSRERGAACYELKLLSRNLTHNRHHRVDARRRRSKTR